MLFIHEKEGDTATCNNTDGTWGFYTKWNKSDREKQMLHGIPYVCNLINK